MKLRSADMRELILKVWCDLCALERVSGGLDIAVNVEAKHTYTLGAVQGESRPALKVLELCDTHDKVATDLIELLGQLGQTPELKTKPAPVAPPPVERQGTAKRLVPCPCCRVETGRNTLVAHVWGRHRTDQRPDLHGVCPECKLRVDSNTGLSAHRRSSHGFDALVEALAGVDEKRYPALVSYRKNGGQV
jgi:hypothetical protein